MATRTMSNGSASDRKASTPRPRRSRGTLAQYALPLIWLVEIAIFGALDSDLFLTTANFATIFGSQAVVAALALAILAPAIAGDYDLSCASNLVLSAMIMALLNVNQGWPLWAAMLAAMAAGSLIGLVNGFIVTKFEIEALIVTLGTGTVLQGIVVYISNSATITGVSPGLVDAVIVQKLLGIPLEFYYVLIFCALLWYLFDFTPLGQRLLFVGRGRDVAMLSGIRVPRMRVSALVISGLGSSLAGILYAGSTGSADPSSGLSFLLPAFAAIFLGATAIQTDRFNPWGTVIAVYFLVTGITGLQILGADPAIQNIFYGGALVIAVTLSQIARRHRERRLSAE